MSKLTAGRLADIKSGISNPALLRQDGIIRGYIIELLAHIDTLSEAASGQQWQPIESAPKSTAVGNDVHGIYILGYCPEPDICNLESAICVVWWEPLMKKGKGMWYGEGGYEVTPTHWMPLPNPPDAIAKEKQP